MSETDKPALPDKTESSKGSTSSQSSKPLVANPKGDLKKESVNYGIILLIFGIVLILLVIFRKKLKKMFVRPIKNIKDVDEREISKGR